MTSSRVLLLSSAIFLAALGVAASLLPQELLRWLGATPSTPLSLLVQTAGSLYLGFAVLNCMLRHQLVGGIYNRPAALANLLHFASAAIALVRSLASDPDAKLLWPIALAYSLFALAFATALFRHPVEAAAAPAYPSK